MGKRNRCSVLTDDRYKLIEYVVKDKRTTQLFDEQTDPLRLTNLADNARYVQGVKAMRSEMLKARVAQGDTTANFWSHF